MTIPDKMKEMLSPVMESGQSLSQLVDDLLEVARSEAGRIEIRVEKIDLVEQVKLVLQQLKVIN